MGDNNVLLIPVTQESNAVTYTYNAANKLIREDNGFTGEMVTYRYDPWGRPVSRGGLLASTIGTLNPFRYRGYVYDEETGLYYLQSRYYDPEICRFLSSDVLLSTGQGVLGHNSFANCGNNPIICYDPDGMRIVSALDKDFDGSCANTYNIEMFNFGLSDKKSLKNNQLYCVEESYSLGTIVVGKSVLFSKNKYMIYYFGGVSKSFGYSPFEIYNFSGITENVNEVTDYAGPFFNISFGALTEGYSRSIWKTGENPAVVSSSLKYSQLFGGFGGGFLYYLPASKNWKYGEAPINWGNTFWDKLFYSRYIKRVEV